MSHLFAAVLLAVAPAWAQALLFITPIGSFLLFMVYASQKAKLEEKGAGKQVAGGCAMIVSCAIASMVMLGAVATILHYCDVIDMRF